jgi:hypothetical protein
MPTAAIYGYHLPAAVALIENYLSGPASAKLKR